MFRFKQFTVCQGESAMKVGTDGVLLGAWCRIEPEYKRMLDVGTGTGLIALMLAQRTAKIQTIIDAVEIDNQSAQQASENFEASPWASRLRVIDGSLQKFACGFQTPVYDHIVSNPPYFSSSLISPDARRTTARHTIDLTYEQLVKYSCMVMRRGGRLSVVLPSDDVARIEAIATQMQMFMTRRTDVFPTDESALPKRSLLEFTHVRGDEKPIVEHSQLIIEQGGRHLYSEQYRELTREFYLKF